MVLDTSSIINCYPPESSIDKYTVPEVIDEAKAITTASSVGVLIERGDLVVCGASSSSLKLVVKKLREIGGKLSSTDINLAALVVDLVERELEPTLMTDDYALQNLANLMGLKYKSVVTEGIKSVYTWRRTCSGCGKVCSEEVDTCPDCGTKLERTVSRRRI